MIATLRSPYHSLALPCLALFILPCLTLPVFPGLTLRLAVRTVSLFGLLLSFQDYLSALPLWILYADRRPTLAPRIALSCLCHTCLPLSDPACFLNMFSNKALHMDPHVSRFVSPVTVSKAFQTLMITKINKLMILYGAVSVSVGL